MLVLLMMTGRFNKRQRNVNWTRKVTQRSKRHLWCATCRFANGQVGFQPRPHGFCLKKWPTHFFKEKPLGRGRSVFRSAPASFTVFAFSWLILPSYMVVVNLVAVIKITMSTKIDFHYNKNCSVLSSD